jgi:HK97 family phage prohead protease
VLAEKPDVIGAPNHDWTQVLGRTTAGTLRLTKNERGLDYEIDINPEDQDAMNLYAKVKRGDISQSSFAFTVRQEEWQYPEKGSKTLPIRVVKEVEKLFDVSPVTFPAYPQTTAAVRSKFESLAEIGSESEATDQAESGGSEDSKVQTAIRRRWIELTQLNQSKNGG